MARRPDFTPEQVNWICYQIGEWYLEWRNALVPDGVNHKLGYAKELLKEKICGDGSIEEYYRLYRINFYRDDTNWRIKVTHPVLKFSLESCKEVYENFADAFKAATNIIDGMEGDSPRHCNHQWKARLAELPSVGYEIPIEPVRTEVYCHLCGSVQ